MPDLHDIPSFDALVADPAKADALSPETAKLILLEVLSLEKVLMLRALMGQSGPATEELLTIPEVAARLKVSPDHCYELARTGVLQSVKLGKAVRVRASAVTAYLAR